MSRNKVEPFTGLTPEILAMTWENTNACRMWFRRRGTTPNKLGLKVVDVPGGVKIAATTLEPVVQALTAAELERFERFADEVDGVLQRRDAGPEKDDVVRGFFDKGLTAEQAAEAIVLQRKGPVPAGLQLVAATHADQAKAVHADSAPLPAGDRFFVQLGLPVDLETAKRIAANAAKLVRLDAYICDVRDGRGIEMIPRRKV